MKCSKFSSLSLIVMLAAAFIIQSPQSKENSLRKGKWALQFAIGNGLDVRGFQGQTLSIKNHTADNRAYRLGFTVALDVGDGETGGLDGGSTRQPGSNDFNSSRLEVNLQKIFYSDVSAPVNVFYGMGTSVSLAHSRYSYENDYSFDTIFQTDYRRSVADSWSVGASGIFGAEWFFAANMSLLGEYNTSLNYRIETRKEKYRSIRNGTLFSSNSYMDKKNSIRLAASTVNLGLSFYF